MLEPEKTKKECATYAFTLVRVTNWCATAASPTCPVDFETPDPRPGSDRSFWMPLNRDKVRMLANTQFDVSGRTAISSFDFMVSQTATSRRSGVLAAGAHRAG